MNRTVKYGLTVGAVILGVWALLKWDARKSAQVKALEVTIREGARKEATLKKDLAKLKEASKELESDIVRLKSKLANLPKDPGPAPALPPNASLETVKVELTGLGLSPDTRGDRLGIGLGDARTVYDWGHAAKRVPILLMKLGTTEEILRATEVSKANLAQRVTTYQRALEEADSQIQALHAKAKIKVNPWRGGFIAGYLDGRKTFGAYAGRDVFGMDFSLMQVGGFTGASLGLRF